MILNKTFAENSRPKKKIFEIVILLFIICYDKFLFTRNVT